MNTKLIIFGITGDLSTRKLLPALKQIIATGQYDNLSIIGVSRREVDVTQLITRALGSPEASLIDRTSVFSMDLAAEADYVRLKDHVGLAASEQLLIYLSVPPQAATRITELLGAAGLNTPNVKILFEKPFGVDYQSAVDVIERTGHYFDESQIYRIDHYLAKEMAQNIVAFRGGNALFSHVWDNQAIEKIEVVAYEKIGIEGRAEFYEPTGALRDVLQGHLMQLLALTLMKIPHDFNWDELPALRLAALQELSLVDPLQVVRGQYEGYQDEVGNIGSTTETFVSARLTSQAPEWEGVPLVLTTGKSLHTKTTEVRVHFRKFRDGQSNCLILHIQPHEGVEIDLFTKKPGYDRDFETQALTFDYAEDTTLPDAYEQVIVDAIRSRKSLFTGNGEVLRSWEILRPIQEAWNMNEAPLHIYTPGSNPADIAHK